MDRQAFRNRMQQLKQYREQNPGKTYFDFKAYADGGEIGDEEKQFLINWYNKRRQYANIKAPYMNKQIDVLQKGFTTPPAYNNDNPTSIMHKGLDQMPIVIDDKRVKSIDKNAKAYYHPNEGIVLSRDWKDKDRENLLHEMTHRLNQYGQGTSKHIQSIINGQKVYDKGKYTEYLTRPEEIYSRLMEFRKLNNLNPLKTYGKPDIEKLRKEGKDTDILNLFPEDDVILDLLNTTAYVKNDNITRVAQGGEIPPNNKPIIPEEPQPYKGKLYKDRYGRKYTESQLDDYYDNSTDEIDRFTGKPFVRGLKPVGDIEDAANMTPVGDAISAYDIYSSIKQSDWQGAGLAAMGLIPFMPMTVKQFRSKYKGITPKQKYKAVSHDYNTSVNRNYIQDRIDEALAYDAAVNSKLTQAKNQTYNVVERLMDDPSYIERAKQVKTQFGDDYIQAYADIINLYNENPLELPNVERLNSGNSRARMQRNSNGTYSYKLDPDIADISAPVTEHELSHYADFKRNLDRPDPHGDSNMFYQMKKDISGRKIDSRDDYYSLPTEQKAHMNQLREYMFQNNYISTRGETVDEKLLKKAIQEADKLDSMRGVARASRQFKSFNKYTKRFNSIPLLSIGAAAVYNNNQEK